jgi:lipid-binding SYLF domain-containing protein
MHTDTDPPEPGLTEPNPPPKPASDTRDQKQLLRRAENTLESLLSDPDYPSLLNLATRAKALLIIPSMLKLSFFFGGHGGSGVLLARGNDGKWSNPAFYTIGGINYGFQIGGQSSELILTIMSEKGLKALLEHELTLGADAGASVGTVGRGAHASTGIGEDADIYAFARSEGLYVGISLDGTIVTPDRGWNEAFYGQGATPEAILLERRFSSPEAAKLVAAMP